MKLIDKVISATMETLGRIKYSPKSAWIRRYTNLMYYDPKTIVLTASKVKVLEVGGYKFYATEALEGLADMSNDPWLQGVRSTDIVLDVGAHVGIMCIPLAKKAAKVYAVEPLYYEELRCNIELNSLTNVVIWNVLLGDYMLMSVRYHERENFVRGRTFANMKQEIGHLDFLKMNCEGGEWLVKPEEYLGIRELRLDYHVGRVDAKKRIREANDLVEFLLRNKYSVNYSYFNLGLHAQHKGFYRISATLEE